MEEATRKLYPIRSLAGAPSSPKKPSCHPSQWMGRGLCYIPQTPDNCANINKSEQAIVALHTRLPLNWLLERMPAPASAPRYALSVLRGGTIWPWCTSTMHPHISELWQARSPTVQPHCGKLLPARKVRHFATIPTDKKQVSRKISYLGTLDLRNEDAILGRVAEAAFIRRLMKVAIWRAYHRLDLE